MRPPPLAGPILASGPDPKDSNYAVVPTVRLIWGSAAGSCPSSRAGVFGSSLAAIPVSRGGSAGGREGKRRICGRRLVLVADLALLGGSRRDAGCLPSFRPTRWRGRERDIPPALDELSSRVCNGKKPCVTHYRDFRLTNGAWESPAGTRNEGARNQPGAPLLRGRSRRKKKWPARTTCSRRWTRWSTGRGEKKTRRVAPSAQPNEASPRRFVDFLRAETPVDGVLVAAERDRCGQ